VNQFLFRAVGRAYLARQVTRQDLRGMSEDKLTAKPDKGPSRPGSATPTADAPAAATGTSRHGAISRRLFTYSNYKSWAEKIRTSWDDDEEPATVEIPRAP
jgi:hypothetical protein